MESNWQGDVDVFKKIELGSKKRINKKVLFIVSGILIFGVGIIFLSVGLNKLMGKSVSSDEQLGIGEKFTVKYNANAGSGYMEDQRVTHGKSTPLSANKFTKPGYNFSGWYAKRGTEWLCYTSPSHQNSSWMDESKCNFGKDPYSDGTSVSNNADKGGLVTMYAVWKKRTCTTQYRCDKGTKVGDGPTAYCHEKLYKAKKTVYECENGFTNTNDGYCQYSATYLYTDKWNRKIYANCNSNNGERLDGSKCKKAAKAKYGSNKASCPNGGIRDGAYCYSEYSTRKEFVCY